MVRQGGFSGRYNTSRFEGVAKETEGADGEPSGQGFHRSPGRPMVNGRDVCKGSGRGSPRGFKPGSRIDLRCVGPGRVAMVSSGWRHATGLCVPTAGRHLSFAEHEEAALLMAKQFKVRQIAREVGRSPSTISREIHRNAATRGRRLEYRASVAQ
jgi:hypothetical protein